MTRNNPNRFFASAYLNLILKLNSQFDAKEKVHPKRWQEQKPKPTDLICGSQEDERMAINLPFNINN